LQSIADPTDRAATLRAAFPEARGVRAPATADGADTGAAGRVDLVCATSPADAARFLRGIRRVLAEDRPAVLASVEPVRPAGADGALFEIFDLMRAGGHVLAAVLAPQVREDGLLAAADLLFLPPALHAACRAAGGVVSYDDPLALLEQARTLQHACDQRLKVIQDLTRAADERLRLIHTQQAELGRLGAVVAERLDVIRGLEDAVRRAERLAEERLADVRRMDAELKRFVARWETRPAARLLRALRRILPGKKAGAA
jgi:hypothetical protein